MKTIAIGKFKAQCLALINDMTRTNENIIITKHGKPVAKVVPIETDTQQEKKPLKGAATFIGDIISPVDVDWEAMQ